ncbi:MAG: hypothetical protein RR630_05100 [Coprobacillus sp.]
MIKIKDKKIYIVIFAVCLLIIAYSVMNDANLFYIVKNFIFNSEYRNAPYLAQDNFFPDMSIFEVIVQVFKNYYWEFDVTLIFGTNLFQIITPLICSFIGIKFYTYLKTILQMKFYRHSSYNKTLLKEILSKSFYTAISFFCAYLVFYFISLTMSQGRLNGSVSRDLFASILGYDLSQSQPYLYYIIEGFIRFFMVPFVYTFFSCSLCLVSNNQKTVLFITNMYYYGLSALAFGLFYITQNAIYINPSSIMVIGSFNGLNSLLLILIGSIPLWIGLIIIIWRGKNVEI